MVSLISSSISVRRFNASALRLLGSLLVFYDFSTVETDLKRSRTKYIDFWSNFAAMLSLGTYAFWISTKTTSFCLKLAKSLIREREYPWFIEATLVKIIRGFGVPSGVYARALNSSSLVIVLTY